MARHRVDAAEVDGGVMLHDYVIRNDGNIKINGELFNVRLEVHKEVVQTLKDLWLLGFASENSAKQDQGIRDLISSGKITRPTPRQESPVNSADVDALMAMFNRAGVRYTRDNKQSRIGSPPGSFMVWTEQPPGPYNDSTWYMCYHFGPDGNLLGVQMNA